MVGFPGCSPLQTAGFVFPYARLPDIAVRATCFHRHMRAVGFVFHLFHGPPTLTVAGRCRERHLLPPAHERVGGLREAHRHTTLDGYRGALRDLPARRPGHAQVELVGAARL